MEVKGIIVIHDMRFPDGKIDCERKNRESKSGGCRATGGAS